MKISTRVEPLVRNTIYAAVKRDFAMLDAALSSFPDDQAVKEAIELTLAVILYVLWDFNRRKPTDAETEAIAIEIAQVESWVEATEAEVVTFLKCLVNGEPFAGAVPTENVYILTFVSAANLLASWRREDEKWWDYLDRAEAAIEAAT